MAIHHRTIGLAASSMLLAGLLAAACGDSSSDTDDTSGSTTGGTEQCGAGTELCGGACTSTAIDPDNCGQCGKACGDGEACQAGACVFECNGGATKCDDSCVDTQHDPLHCGSCGEVCDAAQEVCAAGKCAPSCGSSGLLKCGDECVDQMTDVEHCGVCDKTCEGNETCVAGDCVAPEPPKAVYTMTNDPAGNKILSFPRAGDGTLSQEGTFVATGGRGTGSGLGNQHGLIFDQTSKRFFAVNAGDHTVSMLALRDDGSLELLMNIPSGGERPISVTMSGDLLYVLNAGVAANNTAANISGFKMQGTSLAPIAGSTQPLSAANPGPAQIQFSPDGVHLVVTEKGTNSIDTYTITGDVAGPPTTIASKGMTPFGFDFSADGQIVVSEAAGGQANLSSVSSYSIAGNGVVSSVTAALPTTRTAACWLVVAGKFAYVANAQTNDITGLQIAGDGTLTLLDPSGTSGMAAPAPVDEDVTDGGDILYVVTNGGHAFSVFQIGANGALTKKPDFTGLPTTASGIVAR